MSWTRESEDGLDKEESRGDEAAGHESRRGAEQVEAIVGSAECEEVRRGGEEADRRADDAEVRREIDDADRQSRGTGLSHAEASEEGRISQGQRAPQRVTQAEREEHERTHIPYRLWCDVCVKARGRRMAHRSRSETDKIYEDGIPRICMDYFYMNERDREEGRNPLVIVTDEDAGDKYARAVGRKGVGERGDMDWLIRDISFELKSWRHQGGSGSRLIMKADGERSLKTLRDAVARYHGGIVVPEVSARGECQSNGVAEQAAQVVAEFVRVFTEQIEEKAKVKLSPEDTISLWMVRWAAILCSKYMVGADGRTAYERRRGRRCRLRVVPFGERVLFKQIREGKHRKDKFESEDSEGVWLGHNREANEVLIGTPSGVVRAYSYRRRSEDSRWDADLIKNMQGTP